MNGRTRRVVALAAIALTVVAGCGSGGGGGEAAAPAAPPQSDGVLTIYSGRNENLVGPILERQLEDAGRRVSRSRSRYAGTAAMAAQLLEEGERRPADVFLAQDAGALGAVAKAGLFAPLPAEVIATRRRRSTGPTSGDGPASPARARVLAYNPTLVPAGRTARIGVRPDRAAVAGARSASPRPTPPSRRSSRRSGVDQGEARAKEFLAGLAANEPQSPGGNTQILEDVDAGQIPLGLINHYYWSRSPPERGAAPRR